MPTLLKFVATWVQAPLALLSLLAGLGSWWLGAGSAETRDLLDQWAKLHAVRTALGIAATILYPVLALES
jgi:hypothetical protein